MSREEAHRRPAASRSGAPTGPPAAGRASGEEARTQPPLFTARTDETAGAIATSGHLDRVGAEVLCLVVAALQRLGHRRIVVLLGPSTVTDDDAGTLLADLARRLRTDGVHLLLR